MVTESRRYLVEWTERVTHLDIAYVDDEKVQEFLHIDDDEWAALDDAARTAMDRAYLNSLDDVDQLGGSRRWRVADRSGIDVLQSEPWPNNTEEPKL